MRSPSIQQEYLANWHDSFVNYTHSLLFTISSLMSLSEATEEDKKCFELLKLALHGSDVRDVEQDLANGSVKKSTLDKIEGLNKHLADICLDYIQISPLVREFWKQLAHLKIESDKNAELSRLRALQIPIL